MVVGRIGIKEVNYIWYSLIKQQYEISRKGIQFN